MFKLPQIQSKMKIYIGSDHAGFENKKKIVAWLKKLGHSVADVGPHEYVPKDDYPLYSLKVAESVKKNKNSKGIIVARSGIGEVVAANKVKGIRAVSILGQFNKKYVKMSRIHDNTNVICFGSDFVEINEAKKAIKLWLNTKFTGEKRHKRRLGEIADYEKKNWKGK